MEKPDIKTLPVDLRKWAAGNCLEFALAIEDAAFSTDGSELQFGCHSSEALGIEYVFVYDEEYAYDVFGKHLLGAIS